MAGEGGGVPAAGSAVVAAMISTADVIDLMWDEMERPPPPPQDTLPLEVEEAFVGLLSVSPQIAVLLYKPMHGLDPYVRAWIADVDMNPRWGYALFARFGLVNGQTLSWSQVGKRMGISRQAAQIHAQKGLAELWQRFAGRRKENIHDLREEARACLSEKDKMSEETIVRECAAGQKRINLAPPWTDDLWHPQRADRPPIERAKLFPWQVDS